MNATTQIPPAGPVVLTGAAGRAGRAALKHLLEQGYEVIAVDTQPIPRLEGRFPGSLTVTSRTSPAPVPVDSAIPPSLGMT